MIESLAQIAEIPIQATPETVSETSVSEISSGVSSLSEINSALENGVSYEAFNQQAENIISNSQTVDGLRNAINDIESFDDNGKLYKSCGELLPNNEYSVNGYDYKTDEIGRTIEASGELKLSESDGRKTINERNVGGEDKLASDDRGHLIADRFGGSNKIENLVAQDSNLNRGEYKSLENELADKLKEGREVEMTVEVDYEGESKRPSSFTVTYSVDGVVSEKTFLNESSKGV